MVMSDTHMPDRVMHFGEDLCDTRQFWKRHSSELSDMMKQLGAQGMIFFTFTNLHWPELHKLMPHGENPVDEKSEQDWNKHRRQDLIDNSHIAAWFFEKHFKLFLENVLIP